MPGDRRVPHDVTLSEATLAALDQCAYGPVDLLTVDAEEFAALRLGPGLLDPFLPDDADGITGIAKLNRRADPVDPRHVMALTQDWVAALLVEQDSTLGHTVTVAYLREDGRALIEDVDPAGHHRFIVAKRNAVIDNLVVTLMPFTEDADANGEAHEYTADEWERCYERDWGPSQIVSVVVGLRRAEPEERRALSVFTGRTSTATAVPTADGSALTVARVPAPVAPSTPVAGRRRFHPCQPEGAVMTVDDLTSANVLALDPSLTKRVQTRLSATAREADPFLVLSDEEVVALEGGVDPDYTIAPVLDQLGDVSADDLVTIGLRSLMLRGLMGSSPDADTPRLADDVELAIAGRTTGTAMLRFTSMHGGSRTGCVAMLQPVGAVVEDATIGGFHRFTICSQQAATERLVRWALPVDWPAGAPARELVDSDRLDTWLVNELGTQARVVQAELHWRCGQDQMASAIWLIAHNDQYGVFIDVGSERADGRVLAEVVDRGRLTDRLTDIIGRIHVPTAEERA